MCLFSNHFLSMVFGPRGCDLPLPSWSTFICNSNRLGATAASSPPSSKVVARRDLGGVISDKLQPWIHHCIRSFQQPPLMQKNKSKKKEDKQKKANGQFEIWGQLIKPSWKTNIYRTWKGWVPIGIPWIHLDSTGPPIFSIPKFRRHLGSTASTKWNPYLGWFRWNVGGMPWKYP